MQSESNVTKLQLTKQVVLFPFSLQVPSAVRKRLATLVVVHNSLVLSGDQTSVVHKTLVLRAAQQADYGSDGGTAA